MYYTQRRFRLGLRAVGKLGFETLQGHKSGKADYAMGL